MGGIYKITENLGARGIPFLKDVPVLGHLFRFSDVTDTDEELLFFITPRIIEGSFDDAAMKAAM
jgi:type IV pilus assembly protein PilQ